MAKITLNTITSSFSATSLFNTNYASIATELNDKVLYRNNPAGEANQMQNDLDMNSNNILNAGAVAASTITLDGTLITSSDTTSLAATTLTYDNTTSGLTATNVQAALDEIDSDLDAHLADAVDAHDASSISNVASGNLVATEVQAALNELQTELDSATSGVTSNDVQLAHGNNHGRNLIINGDFSVWQRGTSTSVSGTLAADRWIYTASGGGAAGSSSRQTFTLGQTDVPNNPKYFLRHDVTTGATFLRTGQRIENVILTAAKEMTLSFYAKGTNPAAGSVQHRIQQNFGSGGSPSASVTVDVGTPITLTSSWQRFTTTFTPASITGKVLGIDENSSFLRVDVATQNEDTGTDAWQMDIANVQLEFGAVATDFEIVSPADNLARCQRYAYVVDNEKVSALYPMAYGFAKTTVLAHVILNLPVTLRADPTVTVTNPTQFRVTDGVTLTTLTALASRVTSTTSIDLVATVASGLTAFRPYRLERAGSTTGVIVIDAEL